MQKKKGVCTQRPVDYRVVSQKDVLARTSSRGDFPPHDSKLYSAEYTFSTFEVNIIRECRPLPVDPTTQLPTPPLLVGEIRIHPRMQHPAPRNSPSSEISYCRRRPLRPLPLFPVLAAPHPEVENMVLKPQTLRNWKLLTGAASLATVFHTVFRVDYGPHEHCFTGVRERSVGCWCFLSAITADDAVRLLLGLFPVDSFVADSMFGFALAGKLTVRKRSLWKSASPGSRTHA